MRKDCLCDLSHQRWLRQFAVVTLDPQCCERALQQTVPSVFRVLMRGAIGSNQHEYGAAVGLGMIIEGGRFNDYLCLLDLRLS